MSGRELIVCDYDDTLFRTDDFFEGVLHALKELGQTPLADKISQEINALREQTGSSAGYKLYEQIEPYVPRLTEILAPQMPDMIYPDAARFVQYLPERTDLRILTRGEVGYQELKLAGTMFADVERFPHEILPERDKIAHILSEMSLTATGFLLGGRSYDSLTMIDNDPRYFEGFGRFPAVVAAHGILVHRNNPRFMPTEGNPLPAGVEAVQDFDVRFALLLS